MQSESEPFRFRHRARGAFVWTSPLRRILKKCRQLWQLVYPAAGIVQATRPDCRRVEINLDETPQSPAFDQTIRGPASEEVPKFFESL